MKSRSRTRAIFQQRQRRLLRRVLQREHPLAIELEFFGRFRGGGNICFAQTVEVSLVINNDRAIVRLGENVVFKFVVSLASS